MTLQSLFRVWGKWAAEHKTGERMSQNAFQKALRSMREGPIRPGQKKRGRTACRLRDQTRGDQLHRS